MINNDLRIEQIGKIMEAFIQASTENLVPTVVQAETAMLIFYRICYNEKISKENQEEFIKDAYTLFKNIQGTQV